MEISSEDNKVKILLQEEQHALEQMNEIKKEEMSWLKVFLLVYAGLVAWSANEWLSGTAKVFSEQDKNHAEYLIEMIVRISFSATALFSYHFLKTRESYYGVRERVEILQEALGLYKEKFFHSSPVLREKNRLKYVDDMKTWLNVTKPQSSFFTRMIYLIGGNSAVIFICWASQVRIGVKTSGHFLAFWMLGNVLIFMLIFIADLWYHTRSKKQANKKSRGLVGAQE